MGKQSGSGKKVGGQSDNVSKHKRVASRSSESGDKDMEIFISMSNELKDEGNKLFQKRDHEGALLKYEKAIKLLPKNHVDVSYLRSNMAACFMQMGISEFPRAIHECNLALEVSPKHSKAMLKRARCYEALNRLDYALRDVNNVLKMEPNNVMAQEIFERVIRTLEEKGLRVNDMAIELPPEYVEPQIAEPMRKAGKDKISKKKKGKKGNEKTDAVVIKEAVEEIEEKKANGQIEKKVDGQKKKGNEKSDGVVIKETVEEIEEKKVEGQVEKKVNGQIEKKMEDKVVVEEKISPREEHLNKTIKLVFGDDIRWAQVPLNCSLGQLREVIHERFPDVGPVLVKYRDEEGDLVTITSDEELKLAEAYSNSHGSMRLYLAEASARCNPLSGIQTREEVVPELNIKQNGVATNLKINKSNMMASGPHFIDEWIIEFAKLFKSHVGVESDSYLGLHDLGVKVYSEAMEETVTSEDALALFDIAAEKFQEMAALALFNWGNVHMSRARKRMYISEDASREAVLEQIKAAYEWAQREYIEAGKKYVEALKIKPDFYEALLALGQQQFEQAKLSWYYATGTEVEIGTWNSEEVIELYNDAEDKMERGMAMWEELEARRLSEHSKLNDVDSTEQKKGLDNLFQDISFEEAAEQATTMRSQAYLLWGTILYERSIMEFKLDLPVWHECLEVAVEKFEHAGASATDIAVMIKNHISNDHAIEGVGFKIDEIVQAWDEMYEAKKWERGIPSFRLEPLLRRRVSNIYHALELA